MIPLRVVFLITFIVVHVAEGGKIFPQSQHKASPVPDISQEFLIGSDGLGALPKYKKLSAPPKKKNCTSEYTENQVNCLQALRPNYNGPDIPTTRNETETLCQSFNGVIKCLEEWATVCEDDQLVSYFLEKARYIADIYSPMCKDNKSQAEHYIHGECYLKTNPRVAECTVMLGQKTRTLNSQCRSWQTICCLKQSFIRCVSDAVSHYNCSEDSSKAALDIAKRYVGLHPEQWRKRNTTDSTCAKFMDDNNCKKTLRSIEKSCYMKYRKNGAYSARGQTGNKRKVMFFLALVTAMYVPHSR